MDNQASQLITRVHFRMELWLNLLVEAVVMVVQQLGLAAIGAEGGEGNKADAVEVIQSGNITTGSKEATNSSAVLCSVYWWWRW